jgi:hypothetical protein
MAIVATPVVSGSQILPPASPEYKSWTIACLDADTGPTAFNHGFVNQAGSGVAPDDVQITPLISVANAALANWGVAVSATQITLSKQSAAGSGGASPGTTAVLKVVARVPHTVEE